MSGLFLARYEGWCDRCAMFFDVDDPVGYSADDDGVLLCEVCWDTEHRIGPSL